MWLKTQLLWEKNNGEIIDVDFYINSSSIVTIRKVTDWDSEGSPKRNSCVTLTDGESYYLKTTVEELFRFLSSPVLLPFTDLTNNDLTPSI